MRYVPYGPELERVPNIVVDGRGNAATVLELSHWPGTATPPELKADTSTEIALNYLRLPERETYRRGAEAVSNNHYDIDGLLAMWAVLHPDEALERADLLVAAAECADFERWEGEDAAKVVCALLALGSSPQSPLRDRLAGVHDHRERDAVLYTETLPLVAGLLADPSAYESLWRDEYERIRADRELFASGEARVQEVPELDLAIVDLPRDAHDVAVHGQTACSRVARIVAGERYEFRYRYESWVEYQSRDVPPRVDLREFRELLQSFEGNAGDWVAEDVSGIVPRLFLRTPDGEPGPSSLTPGLFVKLLAQYLRDHADDEALLWSPATAAQHATG